MSWIKIEIWSSFVSHFPSFSPVGAKIKCICRTQLLRKVKTLNKKYLNTIIFLPLCSPQIIWSFACFVICIYYICIVIFIIEVWRSLHSRTLQYQMASSNQLGHRPSSILQPYPIIPGVFSTPTSGSLGCLLARQLCLEDSACNQVLQVIPRVCGLELGKKYIYTFLPFNKIFYFSA